MVEKWSCQNPLSIEERKLIKEGLDANWTYREIAAHAKRGKSTIMREAKRLGDIKDYDPEKAQEHFEEIQKRHAFRVLLEKKKTETLKAKQRQQHLEKMRKDAFEFIIEHGGHDGDHHKAWCLDQVFRILTGEDYEKIVTQIRSEGYCWDEGIAP
jgi:IS30 family transposase